MTEGKFGSGSSASPEPGANTPNSTYSSADQAFIDSYKSAADEYDETAKQAPVITQPTDPTATLTSEDQAFVDSYKSYAEELEREDEAQAAGQPPQPIAKEEETLESLRMNLVKLKDQQATAQAKPAYNMPGPWGTAVRREVADGNAAAIKAIQDKISQLEKEERRNKFMEKQRTVDPELEESPDPSER